MNRDQLLRKLRKHARKSGVDFEVQKDRGKGGHYLVKFGARRTTVQSDLNPGKIRTILSQLGVDPSDL